MSFFFSLFLPFIKTPKVPIAQHGQLAVVPEAPSVLVMQLEELLQ